MKNITFVVSHLCSGSSELISFLNNNPRILIRTLGHSYDHPIALEHLFSLGHKLGNAAAIYGDHILYNHNFGCKAFYKFSKFIYVIRSAKSTLKEIMFEKNEYSELQASRYYAFRLRRIYEMARQTPGAVLLTWDNIFSKLGSDLIDNYLNLKEKIQFGDLPPNPQSDVDPDILNYSQDIYEKYLFKLKQLNLTLVN